MVATELWLRNDIHALWEGQEPFAAAFAIDGETFRALEQRQTLAFVAGGKRYFIKRHRGASWKEIVKNLLQGRLPVVSAQNEYRAIRTLQALGISVPVVAAYGRHGLLPSTFESFLITEDVGPHQNLEEYCQPWREHRPAFRAKQQLITEVAAISRTMHGAGICHRDFYLCHLLRTSGQPLTVIDLHRALIKAPLAQRWIIKDLAGLYFSAMNCGLTRRDLYRFMRQYRGSSLRKTLGDDDGAFWQTVQQRALKLYAKERAKQTG